MVATGLKCLSVMCTQVSWKLVHWYYVWLSILLIGSNDKFSHHWHHCIWDEATKSLQPRGLCRANNLQDALLCNCGVADCCCSGFFFFVYNIRLSVLWVTDIYVVNALQSIFYHFLLCFAALLVWIRVTWTFTNTCQMSVLTFLWYF